MTFYLIVFIVAMAFSENTLIRSDRFANTSFRTLGWATLAW
jgi:hypothetical protein